MLADLWHASPILPSLSVGIIILLIPSTATIHSFPLSLSSPKFFLSPPPVRLLERMTSYAMLCYAAERREGADMIHRGRILAGSSSLPPSLRSEGRRRLPIPPLPPLQPPAIVTTGEQDWTAEGGRRERAEGNGRREIDHGKQFWMGGRGRRTRSTLTDDGGEESRRRRRHHQFPP